LKIAIFVTYLAQSKYGHIERKRIFAYSDRVNFDNSPYGNIRIRWEGRSLWCAYIV